MSDTVTLREYLEALINAHDRRYTEVSAERQRALAIKEQADRDALELSRQAQSYKDAQANELREQINNERGQYATHADLRAAVEKLEATIKPVLADLAAQRGKSSGLHSGWLVLFQVVTLGLSAVAVAIAVSR